MINIEELTGTQLFIVGAMLSKIEEELSKTDLTECDEDTKKAHQYIGNEIDFLNKRVAEQILKMFSESINRMQEIFSQKEEEK